MRFTCAKYPELLVVGKGYKVRFADGVADVDDRKTAAAMKKYAESPAGIAGGVALAAEQPKAEPAQADTDTSADGDGAENGAE
jgi:hypothetical protein